ncbi:glycerophosphodiester phosphodiesterase [Oryzobacter sp. R7]|uniref:glycerophosphodiester phosphodiesterase n=1 Tax=Oryzobacter faecalis TaxID=3388656 RepID=UPI00398C8EA5
MSRPRVLPTLLLLLLTAVLAAVPVGSAAAAAPPDVAVIGHRGSSAAAPENTLASIRLALKQGADYIENDIMRTKDGHLVVTHDLSLAKTTNVEQVFPERTSYRVADYTLAEIKQLDAGIWFGQQFAGERILTLREWVEAVGSSAGMLLEAKDPWAFPGIETDIDKELRSIPTFVQALRKGKVIMQAGDEAWLRSYHQLAPDVPVALLYYTRPTDEQLVAASTWVDAVNPALGNIDKAIVDRTHELGLKTYVWTVNHGSDMNRGIDWGVDGIITDYPDVLGDILRTR